MLCSARCATGARTKGCDACASLPPPPPPPPFFAHSCGPPPESRGLIYFTESLPLSPLSFLSRQRSYAPHTSVLPGEFTRRPEATIRSRVHASSCLLDACPSLAPCALSRWNQWCGFFDAIKENNCALLNFKSRSYDVDPFAREGARGFYMGHVCHVDPAGRSTCCWRYRVGLGEQARRWVTRQ